MTVLGTSLALVASQATVRADEPPEQLVWLKGGGFVRGELVELTPGDHVTLKLLTGEVRKIAWADVDHTSSGTSTATTSTIPTATAAISASRATSSSASASASSPTATTASAPAENVTTTSALAQDTAKIMVIHRGVPMTLQGRSLNQPVGWISLCDAPCDMPVKVGDQEFRVVGPRVTPSNPFRLAAGDGTARIEVLPGSPSSRSTGKILLISGLGTTFAGFAVAGISGISSFDGHKGVTIAGAATGLVGVGMIGVGMAFLFKGSSIVKNQKGEPIAAITPSGVQF